VEFFQTRARDGVHDAALGGRPFVAGMTGKRGSRLYDASDATDETGDGRRDRMDPP